MTDEVIANIKIYVFLFLEFGEVKKKKFEGGGERIKNLELYTPLL